MRAATASHWAHTPTRILKIKLKRSGIRIVYKLVQDRDHMLIIVIGLRSDSAVYKTAARRIAKLDEDALS
ncbi:hypothetical protein SELSPUOL_02392 [Selenomonas sputigena ATCC 35185]|uniref:Toxin-antitoxin system, toxin component, RelE family n=1 Tax=Selenomonas sputigena (strain ATCC 35185 / DSM 20758 / CCUG 44933 / VPI D19B-28) TaxID=546271 RepID=C9LY33_SELS3|nr:hypothetical protein SELSPUOL_02392 [Selenomonas sputigena ATCC 35185]